MLMMLAVLMTSCFISSRTRCGRHSAHDGPSFPVTRAGVPWRRWA
jgi:hypothetical protein